MIHAYIQQAISFGLLYCSAIIVALWFGLMLLWIIIFLITWAWDIFGIIMITVLIIGGSGLLWLLIICCIQFVLMMPFKKPYRNKIESNLKNVLNELNIKYNGLYKFDLDKITGKNIVIPDPECRMICYFKITMLVIKQKTQHSFNNQCIFNCIKY